MTAIQDVTTIVSANWLYEHINNDNIVVLDATLSKATEKGGHKLNDYIPGTRFFDIKDTFSDGNAPFPNTMISAKEFETAARELGINTNSTIVVYDLYGIYSSARAWYMFRSMGHENIAVLNGGLPAWNANHYLTEEYKEYKGKKGNLEVKYNDAFFKDYNYLLKNLMEVNKIIIDARSTDRFKGHVPEPRPGLRKGHIPNSENIPYGNLFEKGFLKDKESLQAIFEAYKNKDELIFSCGSGVTACILALGAEISGIKNYSVYDGSWTEWGSLGQLPLQRD